MAMELVTEYNVKEHNFWFVFVIITDLTNLHEMKCCLFAKLLAFSLICRCTLMKGTNLSSWTLKAPWSTYKLSSLVSSHILEQRLWVIVQDDSLFSVIIS